MITTVPFATKADCSSTAIVNCVHLYVHYLTTTESTHLMSNSMSCVNLCAFITFAPLFCISFPSLSFVHHILIPLFLLSNLSFTLTFRHRASCIYDRRFATLQRTLFICLINKYIYLSDICLTVHH